MRSVNLDADWLYRRLGLRISMAATKALETGSRLIAKSLRANTSKLRQVVGPGSALARSAETGTAALLVGVLLAGYLLTYYLSS